MTPTSQHPSQGSSAPGSFQALTENTARREAQILANRDLGLDTALQRVEGRFPVRLRPAGFPGLVRIITEQQVSVASGKAVFERLHGAFPTLEPEAILDAGGDALRDCGLTRQKTRYVLTLAEAVREGRFDAAACQALPDAEARTYLTGFLGIGRWSASIYMLFCEGRPDIWPPSDVALIKAYATAAERPAPTSDEMERLAERWAPHRGAAAHLLWAYYAVLKGRTPE